jgi:glycosyltransferase involved in cell wall biosynthesis
MPNNLVLINNERIFKEDNNFYCDNIDIKSMPEGLNKHFKISMIGRKSKIKRSHKINQTETKLGSNIIIFLFFIFKTFKQKNNKYLLISITPYTFFSYLLLLLYRKKIFVYLRSNGYEEYKHIFGTWGIFLYHIMFTIISWNSQLISCRSHILRGKVGKVVSPSQLGSNWFKSYKKPNLESVKLLYVGRIKVEKGVFSLLKILKNLKIKATLSLVGSGKNNNYKKINQENVSLIEFENKNDSIIDMYDKHNIFILPSFTEGHPQVLDESLARLRPVIIFEEISHVIGNREGVFVCKRDSISLTNTINHIMLNYQAIEERIIQNKLPTKEFFLNQLVNIIKDI